MSSQPLRSALVVGDYIRHHRTRVLVDALKEACPKVRELHVDYRLRDSLFRWSLMPLAAVELLWHSLRLLWRARGIPADVVFVPFGAYYFVPAARLLSLAKGARVVFDPVLLLHDTYVFNKPIAAEGSLKARLIGAVERVCFVCSDVVLADTGANLGFMRDARGVPAGKLRLLYFGADEGAFRPTERRGSGDGTLRVLWYGRVSLMHGLDVILKAARRLAGEPKVRFTVVADRTSRYFDADDLAAVEGKNVRFTHWGDPQSISLADLAGMVAGHDVSLGCFGVTRKSRDTLLTKEYEALASGSPLVTRERGEADEFLVHGESAYLVPAGDAAGLAEALLVLAADPALRRRLGEGGRAAYLAHCSREKVSRRFIEILRED